MTREEFAARCERAAAQVTVLPVTSAILAWTAGQLKKGEPAWWKGVAKAWEKRLFTSWAEAPNLFVACLHFEALNDADNVLVPYFPSCGGTAEADPSSALNRFLSAAPAGFYENLRTRQQRPFRGGLASLWMSPALLFFQRRRLPYYLVEAESGAGLALAADLVRPLKNFRSELVDARVGLDSQPLVIEDLTQRRWLTACQFPDDGAAIVGLDAAIEKVLAANKDDASFIQLAPCPAAKAPAFIAKNFPVDDDAGLLFFNMGVTGRMPDPDYAAYAKGVLQLLSKWGDRGLWVELELVRGETYSTTLQLRVYRAVGGALRSMIMMTLDLQSGAQQYIDAVSSFLDASPKQ